MNMQTGKYIKSVREKKNVTVEQLASSLRVEIGYIEKVENQEIVPSISDLLKIANALNTDIASLIFGKEIKEKKAMITRSDSRERVDRQGSFDYESLAPYYSGRHMEPFVVEVHEQTPDTMEYSHHIGEEFHYVLEGDVKIIVDKTEYMLSPGDTIYFDSSLAHALSAVHTSSKLISVVYNGESMLQLTRGKYMRDLIHAAKILGGKNIAVVCPDEIAMGAVNKGIEEGVIRTAYLIGNRNMMDAEWLLFPKQYVFIDCRTAGDEYYMDTSRKGVDCIRNGSCHLLMKGKLNTAIFLKAVLHKQDGITTGRRLSLIAAFELPSIDRMIFLTDPGINPELVAGSDLQSSIDIINNAIDVAKSMGVGHPKIALLEANEVPSDKIPITMYEKQLSGMHWNEAEVYGPLSYDLALYEEAAKNKGLLNNPVAGKADVLVVPHLSGGNFLYKAWAMTMNADLASIVVGAKAPLIVTSRNDNDRTKFLTMCACSVYSHYLIGR